MGTCIICGTSTDGRVCRSHQEDVAFGFRGDRPDQLVSGRYYRGSVDGFADFGVFVDIDDDVTGLLHKSEIDGRLESLAWEPGDTVYVQVLDVHDNGNVDLGWSIRQAPREFRGRLVHDPTADGETEFEADSGTDADDTDDSPVRSRAGGAGGTDPGAPRGAGGDAGRSESADRTGETDRADDAGQSDDAERTDDAGATDADATADDGDATPADDDDAREPEAEAEHVTVAQLDDRTGDRVRLEGEITDVRQTGGPTVFELADETGSVDCAAFRAAGERAYPDVEVDAVVALVGVVERHRGDLQIETESIDVLDGEEHETVADRLSSALDARASAPGDQLLADDSAVESVRESLDSAATALRRAVFDGRPVVIRHAATVDGYVAGASLERALLELVREVHAEADAEYHYLERRPLPEDSYDMSAATDDVTDMLGAAARHDEPRPLVAFAAVGETAESVDGLELLDIYDAERVVVAAGEPDEEVVDAVDAAVGVEERSAATLAANVGALATPGEAGSLAHLPAISYWGDAPAVYRELASDHGYDDDTIDDLRAAVAVQAYYQSWEDKRELARDLLWSDRNRELAADVAAQFRDRLDDELRTAEPHVDVREVAGVPVRVLDVEAFTHQYDFPPTTVLLDELHRRADDDPVATVGVGEDDLRIRTTGRVDVTAVAEAVAERLPEAGVRPRGGRQGRVEFLRGERDAVVDAVVAEVGGRLADESEGESGADTDASGSPDADDAADTPSDADVQVSED